MIPITKPFLGEEEIAASREAILSGWVTQGPKVKQFENAFASYVGSKYACAVSSCTTALHLALIAVGVKPGDVVITVSHSFIATANAIRYCGAEPIFIDIDFETYNMDPGDLERHLHEDFEKRECGLYYKYLSNIAVGESPLHFQKEIANNKLVRLGRLAAILPVHQMGIPCDIEQIIKIANKYELPVVEDAACAVGSDILRSVDKSWEKIGKPHGEIACFSFHPRKILTTGDGGMITTNNSDFDMKFRLLRQHGMSIPDLARHSSKRTIQEEYLTTGFNYRMTDIQAAIGIEQLKKLDKILAERRQIARKYDELLNNMPYLKVLKIKDNILPNWQSYPVKILKGAPLSQMEIIQNLLDMGIATRPGIMNAHKEIAYSVANWSLPNSEACRDRTILLPIYSGIGSESLEYIVETLLDILSGKYQKHY